MEGQWYFLLATRQFQPLKNVPSFPCNTQVYLGTWRGMVQSPHLLRMDGIVGTVEVHLMVSMQADLTCMLHKEALHLYMTVN